MNPPARKPDLSVIIPVRNGGRYLGEAITSVLQEGTEHIEIIILVDESSEDDTARVAGEFATAGTLDSSAPTVRCVSCPHKGLAAARNLGISLARGLLLMHLDADDIVTPGSISVRLSALMANPDADMVTGMMASFVSPELTPEESSRYDLPTGPQRGGLPGASIVRAAFAERVGLQDTSLAQSSDLDWMIRAGEAGAKIIAIPDVVLLRRIHGKNMSLASNGAASRLQILRAAIARRARTGKAAPG
jgi:glycosyltransferase involved in cell wall biosynthesis